MATKLQNNRVYQIDLDLIDPNPWQPRLTTDPADIEDLAQNIDELGLLQEPLLRPSGDRYQSAFGHRRIEAVRLLVSRGKWNRKGLPARLQEMSDRDMAYVALSENTKRRDISPLEVIKAWARALLIEGMNEQTLAEHVGVDRTTIINHLKVLKLPEAALELVHQGKMSVRAARELLCLNSPSHMHADQVLMVLSDCGFEDKWGVSVQPDYRVKTIRASIRALRTGGYLRDYTRSNHETQKRWRSLEGASFDVDAFKDEFMDSLHLLPEGGETGGKLCTCAVKEWSRWSSKATREKNAGKADESGDRTNGTAPSDANSPAKRWLRMIRKDPVVIGEIGGKRARGLRDVAKDLTDEERDRLGSRVEIVKVNEYFVSSEVGQQVLPPEAYPEDLRPACVMSAYPPPGFDFTECRACVSGASWLTNHGGDDPVLVCTNKKAWADKKSVGMEGFRKWFKETMDVETIADLELVEYLANAMPAGWGRTVFVANEDFVAKAECVNGWPQNHNENKFKHYPSPALNLAMLLGHGLPPLGGFNWTTQEQWRKAVGAFIQNPPADVDWGRIGALILVWHARVKLGMGKALVPAGTDGKKSGAVS